MDNRRQNDFSNLVRLGFEVQLVDENVVTEFVVAFVAPSDSMYSGYKWKVQVELPDGYPNKPPIVFFKDKIYHPNIDEEWGCDAPRGVKVADVLGFFYGRSGFPCVNTLDDGRWTSGFELSHVFELMLPQLLLFPNPNDPYNEDAGALYNQDIVQFAERVKDHCKKNATPV